MTYTYAAGFALEKKFQLQLPAGIFQAVVDTTLTYEEFAAMPPNQRSQCGIKFTKNELKIHWNIALIHRQKLQKLWDARPREITEDDCF